MIRPDRPAWEISMQQVGHAVLAVFMAAFAALIVWRLSIWWVIGQAFGLAFFFVTFIVFAVVLYFFLEWLFRKMPDEVAKRVPTSRKELRRRTEQFFDNLPK